MRTTTRRYLCLGPDPRDTAELLVQRETVTTHRSVFDWIFGRPGRRSTNVTIFAGSGGTYYLVNTGHHVSHEDTNECIAAVNRWRRGFVSPVCPGCGGVRTSYAFFIGSNRSCDTCGIEYDKNGALV